MKKKSVLYITLFLVMFLIGGFINKYENTSYVSTIVEANTRIGDEEFWTEVNDIKEINNQLESNFKIVLPKDFKISYMAKGNQTLVDKDRINPWGKLVCRKDEKQITIQIVKGVELFQYARINYDAIENTKIHAFYDKDTKRIVYLQGEYTVLIDIEGMEQDFSLVGMAKLEK